MKFERCPTTMELIIDSKQFTWSDFCAWVRETTFECFTNPFRDPRFFIIKEEGYFLPRRDQQILGVVIFSCSPTRTLRVCIPNKDGVVGCFCTLLLCLDNHDFDPDVIVLINDQPIPSCTTYKDLFIFLLDNLTGGWSTVTITFSTSQAGLYAFNYNVDSLIYPITPSKLDRYYRDLEIARRERA